GGKQAHAELRRIFFGGAKIPPFPRRRSDRIGKVPAIAIFITWVDGPQMERIVRIGADLNCDHLLSQPHLRSIPPPARRRTHSSNKKRRPDEPPFFRIR